MLFSLLLVIHLLCVLVASAGPAVAACLDWREAKGDRGAGRAGRMLAIQSIVLLLAGSLIGLAQVALRWDADYQSTLELFQRRIVFGVYELVFSLVLMIIAAAWWWRVRDSSRAGRGVRMLLQVLAATNLLYHFPLLFILISDASRGATELPGPVDGARFRQLVLDGWVMARAVHFWLAAFAVTGGLVMGYSAWQQPSRRPTDVRTCTFGARLALSAVVCQLPVGLWLVAQAPSSAQRLLLGGDVWATGLLGLSLALALYLLHQLLSVALEDTTRSAAKRSVAAMVGIVTMMTIVLVRLGG